jgi:adenylosuccinate lyase
MTRQMMLDFIAGNELVAVPAADRQRLAEMTPASYIGNATAQAKDLANQLTKL